MLELTPAQRRALRARAHHLDPVVAIGQHGLTPAVLHEIDVALKAHELIKVRVFDDDRKAREALLQEVCAAVEAAPVQHLGKLLVIWRENPDKGKAAARPRRKAKPEPGSARETKQPRNSRQPRATEQTRASAATGRRRAPTASAARPMAPTGVPRAGLPRRRRARG